jgi:hypothetical protein
VSERNPGKFKFLILLAFGMTLVLGFKYRSERPKIEWDTSPNNVVISSEFFILRHIDYNYISDFRVWGDGYIVWVEYQPDGSRKVFEGNLSQAQLQNLLEQFVDAGFFNWFSVSPKDSYEDLISINLLDRNHSVQYYENRKIYELVSYIRTGGGAVAREFVPSMGYLYIVPAEKADLPKDVQPQYHWSSEKFGYDLTSINNDPQNGNIKITGEALSFAWEIANSPHAVVESGGKAYWIAVIIPKITE